MLEAACYRMLCLPNGIRIRRRFDFFDCAGRSELPRALWLLRETRRTPQPRRQFDFALRLRWDIQTVESILVAAGFDRAELEDIFAVLQSKGGCCDCEVLYNVAETSRLKANYWLGRAAEQIARTPHTSPSRPD
jgi:hypothetical protein